MFSKTYVKIHFNISLFWSPYYQFAYFCHIKSISTFNDTCPIVTSQLLLGLLNNHVTWPNVYNGSVLDSWAADKQFQHLAWQYLLVQSKFTLQWYNRNWYLFFGHGCNTSVATFGSLWCHSHVLKLVINSFSINTEFPPNIRTLGFALFIVKSISQIHSI